MEKASEKSYSTRLYILANLAAMSVFILYFHFAILSNRLITPQESIHFPCLSYNSQSSGEHNTYELIAELMSKAPPDSMATRKVNAPSEVKIEPEFKSSSKIPTSFPFARALQTVDNNTDPCGGRYIYVHDLPSRFNDDLLRDCEKINRWEDRCKFMVNDGLGPPLEDEKGVFSSSGWYATDPYFGEVIFRNRMKQYECLTKNSSIAAAVFVPFFAGFELERHLWGYNNSVKDASSLELVDWLMKRPEWQVMGGKDHFMVSGRTTWDYRRSFNPDNWGSMLLLLPAMKNMSMLLVESSPWNSNDFAIPYPTYFHPANDDDVFEWQERMRKLERKHLFSFAGAPRPDNPKSIRGQLIDQCKNSKFCKLLECDMVLESKCRSPSSIMQLFQSSLFCLQPQGDTYTRRSAFDSMLAGCIPVFFHPGSAYVQYTWHLPKNYSTYSVFISEHDIQKNVSIEERLKQIPPDVVKAMRETVISLIPRLIYADPRAKLETLKDAFDVSVQSMVDKISKLRRDMIEGRDYQDIDEEHSWKYSLLEEGQRTVEAHEWDPFFS